MPKKNPELEFYPNAWERFERAAKIVAKSPPQHRKAKQAAKRKARAKR